MIVSIKWHARPGRMHSPKYAQVCHSHGNSPVWPVCGWGCVAGGTHWFVFYLTTVSNPLGVASRLESPPACGWVWLRARPVVFVWWRLEWCCRRRAGGARRAYERRFGRRWAAGGAARRGTAWPGGMDLVKKCASLDQLSRSRFSGGKRSIF